MSKCRALLLIWGINALLMVFFAPHWWQGVIAGLLIAGVARLIGNKAAAAAEGTLPGRQIASSAAEAASVPLAESQALPAIVQGVVPVWHDNVQLARNQTQEAIDNLTQRFVGIHQRLGGAVSLAEGGKNADVLQVIQKAAAQLGGIAAALEEVLSTRDALLRRIEMLGQHNDEIRQEAQAIEQISGRTSVSDLFADQQSWTELAVRSAGHAGRIIDKTKSVQQQIKTALVSANQLNADATRIIDDSRLVIDSVIADFRQSALKLSGTVSQLEEENREVDQDVCNILVNLQFQDRISQILEHVQRNMEKLVGLLRNAEPLPECRQWLADLEKTYTTLEERQLHAGKQADKSMQSQVDFF